MNKILLFALLFFASLNLAGLARIDKYQALSKLNLTSAQQEQIEQIKAEKQLQIGNLQTQLKEKQSRLSNLQKDDSASDTEVKALEESIDATQANLSNLRVKSWLKIKSVLTPEQINQLRSVQFEY